MPYGLLNYLKALNNNLDVPDVPNLPFIPPNSEPALPSTLPMQSAPQAPVTQPASAFTPPAGAPAPQGGSGFMDFIGSPAGKGLLYGAGMGLLAKMNNRYDPVVPTALTAAKDMQKQETLKALGNQIASADLTPAQKAFVQAAFASGDEKLIEQASKFLETAKPSVVGAGGALVDAKGNLLYQNPTSPNRSRYAGAQALDKFNEQLKIDNDIYGYGFTDKELKVAADRYIKGYTTMPDGTPLPELQGEASEIANQVIKAGTNSAGLTQSRAAIMVDKILQQGESQIADAAKYAGIAGQGGLVADRVKAGFGKGTKEYQNYIKFTRVTVPAAVNAAIKAEGANMSDDAKKLLINSLNPIAFDTDFDTAMAQYKYFQELYGSQISPTTISSQTDIRSGIRGNQNAGQQQMVTIKNNVTGETKTVSLAEAQRLGAQ